MDKTAVIILNYLTWEATVEEARLVCSHCPVAARDVIIVDNCSPNDSAAQLREYCDQQGHVFLASPSNTGYAAGNNLALRYAREQGYRYGLILNNDILFSADILSPLVSAIQAETGIAAVSPRILAPDGYEFNRDAKYPTVFDLTFGMLAYKKKGRQLEDLGGWGYVYRPQGCCMLLELDKLQQAGDMDERTFLYCEEIILAERLLAKGYRCAALVEDAVIHNHSTTVRSVFNKRRYIAMNQKSFSLYLKEYRHFSWPTRLLCQAFMVAKLMVLE